MVILRPVFIELFGPLNAGTLLSYIATNPQPNGSAIKWLYNHQCAGVKALSLIAVWCNDPSTKLSTSTEAAIEPNIMTIMYIFFSLWISTSFGISAGIWAISNIISEISYINLAHNFDCILSNFYRSSGYIYKVFNYLVPSVKVLQSA